MPDDTMALRGLLQKSSDADLLREMIGFAAERLPARKQFGALTKAEGDGPLHLERNPIIRAHTQLR